MQKSSVQDYCSLLKPKLLKYRERNERNVKRSSIAINFHSHWGEETYLKAKKWSKFRRRAALLHDRMLMQIIILHTKAKAWVFANRFCSHFNARRFSNRSRTWNRLLSNNAHCHFCFWSLISCSKFAICISVTWKHCDLHVKNFSTGTPVALAIVPKLEFDFEVL